jgi:hypothetical protein
LETTIGSNDTLHPITEPLDTALTKATAICIRFTDGEALIVDAFRASSAVIIDGAFHAIGVQAANPAIEITRTCGIIETVYGTTGSGIADGVANTGVLFITAKATIAIATQFIAHTFIVFDTNRRDVLDTSTRRA